MKQNSKFVDFMADLWFGIVYFLLYWKSSKRKIIKLVAFAWKRFRKTLGMVPTAVPESRRSKMMFPVSSETEKQRAYKERVESRRKAWMDKVASGDQVRLTVSETSDTVS
jgi:hypothetical protein